jgi:hypothetical protein
METTVLEKSDLRTAIQQISLAEVEQKLAELDAERAALSTLRRSLVAREKVKRRRQPAAKEGRADAV